RRRLFGGLAGGRRQGEGEEDGGEAASHGGRWSGGGVTKGTASVAHAGGGGEVPRRRPFRTVLRTVQRVRQGGRAGAKSARTGVGAFLFCVKALSCTFGAPPACILAPAPLALPATYFRGDCDEGDRILRARRKDKQADLR